MLTWQEPTLIYLGGRRVRRGWRIGRRVRRGIRRGIGRRISCGIGRCIRRGTGWRVSIRWGWSSFRRSYWRPIGLVIVNCGSRISGQAGLPCPIRVHFVEFILPIIAGRCEKQLFTRSRPGGKPIFGGVGG